MTPDNVGVHVTLREIYDVALMGARTSDGTRSDIKAVRKDLAALGGRLTVVERKVDAGNTPAYLKKAAYSAGGLVAGFLSAWGAVKGG